MTRAELEPIWFERWDLSGSSKRKMLKTHIARSHTCTFIILIGMLVVSSACSNESEALTANPMPTSMPRAQTSESWLVLPPLPSTATQADVGAEIYRLVCQACHGNRRQGLTDDWRAEWSPQDQNCWQSKCHASNHPPEGFIQPRYVPPLESPSALQAHETALDLYNYIRNRMPWHAPGSLQDTEYWQVTAFLIRERGLVLGDLPLGEVEAASLPLHP